MQAACRISTTCGAEGHTEQTSNRWSSRGALLSNLAWLGFPSWGVPGKRPLIPPSPGKVKHSSACVMQVNWIALVAFGSMVAGEWLHDSRCFDKYQGVLGLGVACHGARVRASKAWLPSYSACAVGR